MMIRKMEKRLRDKSYKPGGLSSEYCGSSEFNSLQLYILYSVVGNKATSQQKPCLTNIGYQFLSGGLLVPPSKTNRTLSPLP